MEKTSNIKPNSYTYNAVLSAAAFTNGPLSERNEALHIAVSILEQALNQAAPHERTHVTYGLFFTACAKLTQGKLDRIERLVDEVFSRCCEDGQVDQKILLQFRNAATPRLTHKYFGVQNNYIEESMRNYPTSWSRNVIHKSHERKIYSIRKKSEMPKNAEDIKNKKKL